MVGEACLPSNAYYSQTPDYTLYSGVHACLSEHSDSSFVYGFMSLDYGLGTMTPTTERHEPKYMEYNQVSMESKHYLVIKLHSRCLLAYIRDL